MTNQIEEKLKKLYALAQRGVEGERENAEVLLNRLLKRYNMTLADIQEDPVKRRRFRYKSFDEKIIIGQVVYKVLHINKIMVYDPPNHKYMEVQLSASQFIEVRELADACLISWRKEKEYLLSAFIHRNELFGKPNPNAKPPRQPTSEEMARLRAMMQGMRPAKVQRKLGYEKT